LIPVATLAFILYFVHLPFYVLGPGPARDVEPLIHVTGTRVYESQGHFLLTAVTFDRANVYGMLRAWTNAERSVVPERDILGPGRTEEEEFRVARSEMDTSKIDAAIVALSLYAGYPDRRRPGALVERVFADTPAEGKLFAGDVIRSVDGRPVAGPGELGERIVQAGPGRPLRLTVGGRPDGTVNVTVTPERRRIEGKPRTIIGVSLFPNFPFPLTIESGQIGGPSAGLMWALGLTDVLTAGDLTGGRTIAGTGAIDYNGLVYPIGGVAEKVVAARRAGADLFFVPVQDAAAARRAAGGIAVVAVTTFRDALDHLGAPPPPRPAARSGPLG
jgi:PDZ domain-containing protein